MKQESTLPKLFRGNAVLKRQALNKKNQRQEVGKNNEILTLCKLAKHINSCRICFSLGMFVHWE